MLAESRNEHTENKTKEKKTKKVQFSPLRGKKPKKEAPSKGDDAKLESLGCLGLLSKRPQL